MAEYVVKGAEPNETVLHTRTPNGYESWQWLPVRERIVRCRDCESATDHCEGMDIYWCEYLSRYVGADMFCSWASRKEGRVMTKLEPTRTSSDLTATERLRALLDERGVPWKDYSYENHTWWGEWYAENRPSVNGLFLKVEGVVTPEQAIAATLGDSDTTGARQGDAVEVVRCRDCAHAVVSRPFYTFAGRPADIEVWRCDYFWNVDEPPEVEPDGFCAWGKRRESE